MKARFFGSTMLEERGLAAQMLARVNEILVEKGLMLKAGSAVDATLIAAPNSTKNGSGTRDPKMQSTQKGANRYIGMKARIGVDAQSGLVRTVIGTASTFTASRQPKSCCTASKRMNMRTPDIRVSKAVRDEPCSLACRDETGRRRQLDLSDRLVAIYDQIERLKAGIRAKDDLDIARTRSRVRNAGTNGALVVLVQ